MKLISGWIIPVTDFKPQNQSIALRQLVPVCLWLMTPPALGKLNFGIVFMHKPRKKKTKKQPAGQNMALQERFPGFPASQQPTIRSQTPSVEGGCCSALPWHVPTPRTGCGMILPSPDGWESSKELPHHLANITELFYCLLGTLSSCDRPASMWELWLWPGKAPGNHRYGARSRHPTSKTVPVERHGASSELTCPPLGLAIRWFKAKTLKSKILCNLLHGYVPCTILLLTI